MDDEQRVREQLYPPSSSISVRVIFLSFFSVERHMPSWIDWDSISWPFERHSIAFPTSIDQHGVHTHDFVKVVSV